METIKLVFSGDLAPIGRVEVECINGKQDSFVEEIKPLLYSVDLHITNLECPLTLSSEEIDKSGPAIKADPKTISLLKSLNVGLACMANNHIRDYDTTGVIDTLNLCHENGVQTVGAGENKLAAAKIQYISLKGKKLAFINYCEEEFSIATISEAGANHLDLIQAFYDINEARKTTDLIFIIVHGGHEEFPLPSPRIKQLYHYLADLGASAVIGHHPHVFSGFEIYHGKPLVYSLGNFIFDEPENSFSGWFTGALAQLTIKEDNSVGLNMSFISQSKEKLSINIVEGEDLVQTEKRCKELSAIISDDIQLEKEWKKFAFSLKNGFIKNILQLNKVQRALLKLGFFQSYLIKKSKLLPLLDIITCESHRDILIESITNQLNNKNESRHS